MEPDSNPYCGHPTVIAAGNPFGLNINNAIREHCGKGPNSDLTLWEQHPLRKS